MSIHPRASIRILQNASLRLHRTILTAPAKPVGSLLTRHPDRALPKLHSSWQIWLRTFPIFVAVMTASTLCIFNYQKSSSSVVSSTLYALRMSEIGRRELGDEIYFRDKFPWIWGEMNQLHGRINISFAVKGTKASGHMRFKCVRRARMGFVSNYIDLLVKCC